MPREIKHRGFVPDQETWITGNLIGNNVIVGEIVDFNDEYFTTEFWQKVDPESVGQYTGLKDIAGTEIYEGNIAQKAGNRYLIKWCDKTARYVVEVLKAYALLVRGVEFPLWQYVEENGQVNLEVIGNIYEHPELLES